MLPVFYINLDTRPDRRAFMETQFFRLGILATRIPATTPAELSATELDRYCNPRRYRWMSPPALCCSLSHIRALTALLDTGAPLGLVLEDDAELSSRLPAFLAAAEQAPPPFDIIRIEANSYPVRLLTRPVGAIGEIGLRKATGWAAGSAGYLASRRAAARIAAGEEMFRTPVDEALFNPYRPLATTLRIVHADPGLCTQLDAAAPAGASSIAPHPGFPVRPPSPLRLAFAVRGILDRDVRMGALKLYGQLVRGARKRRVPFLA